jgi:hypothetical protein
LGEYEFRLQANGTTAVGFFVGPVRVSMRLVKKLIKDIGDTEKGVAFSGVKLEKLEADKYIIRPHFNTNATLTMLRILPVGKCKVDGNRVSCRIGPNEYGKTFFSMALCITFVMMALSTASTITEFDFEKLIMVVCLVAFFAIFYTVMYLSFTKQILHDTESRLLSA